MLRSQDRQSIMTLGNKIKTVRQQKKMSQNELAELSGVMQKNISRYEQDTSVPSALALKKIADALEVTTDYLLGENEEDILIQDKDLLQKFKVIQGMTGETKNVVTTFLDLIIRDHITKKAYSPSS